MRLPTAASFALVTALFASPALRADPCKRIDTTIASTFFLEGCKSPVGVCTQGRVRSGPLEGTTRFSALSVREGPSPDLLFYTGELVITTRSGTVTIHDAGVLDGPRGWYFELQRVVGGTRAHQHSTGALTSQGQATATGFSGSLTGMLCKGNPRKGAAETERVPADARRAVDPGDTGA